MATHQSILKSVKPVILGILCGLVTASAVWDLLRPIIYNYSVNNSTVALPDIIPDPSIGGCTLPYITVLIQYNVQCTVTL